MKNMRFVNTLKKCDRSQILDKLQKKNAIFDLSWMKEEEAESFQVLSEQFVKDARAFDETLKDEDIFSGFAKYLDYLDVGVIVLNATCIS